MSDLDHVVIYANGACAGNPGAGGYAAVLISGERRKELTGGRRLTTNNRMELLAAVAALEALKWPCRVTVRSGSRYLVDGGNQRQTHRPEANRDLWANLRDICEKHEVAFEWVSAREADPELQQCRRSAQAAARREELPEDAGYGMPPAQDPRQLTLFD